MTLAHGCCPRTRVAAASSAMVPHGTADVTTDVVVVAAEGAGALAPSALSLKPIFPLSGFLCKFFKISDYLKISIKGGAP